MPNAKIPIGSLFDKNRLSSTFLQNITFLMYFPIGVALAIIRMFVTLQVYLAALLLPPMTYIRSVCFRVLFSVLGIVATKDEMSGEQDESVTVMVANHVSKLDCIPLHILTGCISPSMWDLPSPLPFVLGLRSSKQKPNSIYDMVSFFKSHLSESKTPILFFPEGETTNGRVGLLKFADWSVTVSNRIQPVVIQVWRPWFMFTNVCVLGASWYSDLFWFLFTPYTLFTIRFLPIIERAENESDEAVANKLQEIIASSLNVKTTKYTAQDKREYEKKYLFEQNAQNQVRNRPGVSTEVLTKAQQVLQVLPHIPLEVAVRELIKNRNNVDVTITNILENSSNYSSSWGASSNGSASISTNQTTSNPSKAIFSNSPQIRMSSFAEKKAQLIAEARQKYIEKHGLKFD